MNSARQAIINLGRELAEQDDKASDLWTWLPSYKAAQQAHGDYAGQYRPSIANLLEEATLFISHGLAPTEEQAAEARAFYQCPCGEAHSQE